MQNINRVIMTGHLTRSPELKATASGTDVLSFSMAVNDSRKNKQTGQWEDYANFVDCVVFGTRANSLSKILDKGALVCVEGRLHYDSWERDGLKRSKLSVIADQVEVMRKRENVSQSKTVDYDPKATQEVWEPPTQMETYEDIPF